MSDEKDTSTPPPEAAPTAPRRSVLPLLATLVSLVALGAAVTQPLWVGRVYPAPVVPAATAYDDAALKAEIVRLQERLALLEARPLPAPAPLADLAPLASRVAALEARPVGSDTAALEKAIADMRGQLGEGERMGHAQKTLMIAALQLVTAWQGGQAFEAPWLTALAAAGAADPALATALDDAASTLLPWRDKGIPTLSRLTASYPAMAQHAVAASQPKGESWWQQSLARIKGLVVVRRQGESVSAEDTAADAILARAEAKLAVGDLAASVTELEQLGEAPAAAAAEWLAGARARLLADALAGQLTQHAAQAVLGESALPQVPAATDVPTEATPADMVLPEAAP